MSNLRPDQHPHSQEEDLAGDQVPVTQPDEASVPDAAVDAAIEPDDVPLTPAAESPERSLHDLVGAFVLGVIGGEERAAFVDHLGTCGRCQAEVTDLRPVAALLPWVMAPAIDGDSVPLPSDLSDRIMTSIVTARTTGQIPGRARAAAKPADAPQPERPKGRIRAGATEQGAPVRPSAKVRRATKLHPAWLAAGLLALVAVVSLLWALSMMAKVEDLNTDKRVLNGELGDLRANANATAYTLQPGPAGPPNAIGTVLLALDGSSAVLEVRGLEAVESEEIYQVWYVRDTAPDQPVAGSRFRVTSNSGVGTASLESDTSTYDRLFITREPRDGSEQPTGESVLTGSLAGAAG